MSAIISLPKRPPGEQIPPLQSGDHLTVAEFERRYSAMPEVKKAELINGVVYMPMPVNHDDHGNPHLMAVTWIGLYMVMTPGTDGGGNSTLRLSVGESQPQPDAFLRILPKFGGQSRTVAGYITGAPELVLEIAASSVSYDLHAKLDVYRQNGVREYVVWRVWDSTIDWFVLRENQYERIEPAANGICQSEVFPGLRLDTLALVRRDYSQVLQTLHLGLASPEHAEFVVRLQTRAAQP